MLKEAKTNIMKVIMNSNIYFASIGPSTAIKAQQKIFSVKIFSFIVLKINFK